MKTTSSWNSMVATLIIFLFGIVTPSISFWEFSIEYDNQWNPNIQNSNLIETSYKKSDYCERKSIFDILKLNIQSNSVCESVIIPTPACSWIIPSNAELNGTEGSGTYTYNTSSGVCNFQCSSWYSWSGAISSCVSQYPWCDTPDYTAPNGQVVTMCNVGASQSYNNEVITNCNWSLTNCNSSITSKIGHYFQWGRNDVLIDTTTSTKSNSTPIWHNHFILWGNWTPPTDHYHDYLLNKNDNLWGWETTNWTNNWTYSSVSWSDKILMQWPCESGYHIPTIKEWVNLTNSISPWLNLPSNSDIKNNTEIRNILKLPLMWYRMDFNWSYGFWSTLYLSSSPWQWPWTNVDGYALWFYYSSWIYIENTVKASGGAIRCFKN